MTPFHYQHTQAATEEEFVQRGAMQLEHLITEAVAKRGQCILGLSGGSTPRGVYETLALSPHSDSLPRGERIIDWSKVFLFLVDERYIPKDSEESTQRLIGEMLLLNARIPRSNLVFPNTSLGIENCVRDYEECLRSLLAEGPPDIVVLGMGEDGHIASLFPGDKAALEERAKMVLHTTQDHFAIRDRITVTLPLLTSARSTLFLLKGQGKRKVFEEMLEAPFDSVRYPAHALLDTGKTTWVTCW